ncbi:MAG: hypothetical protein JOY93_02645 [Acidobacteriales bacterium]|nr:hypothetical protein [Terriglobales bacterium]
MLAINLAAQSNDALQIPSPSPLPKASPSQGKFDGPAELPRISVDVSIPQQTGKNIDVREGGNLQQALDHAKCGDTIRLQQGMVFAGKFELPAKPCDDNHWIVIRTAAADSALPPPGTRLTPCYSGVNSLPGRKPLNCSSTEKITARIDGRGPAGPITFAAGANHYRFIGLELSRGPDNSGLRIVYQIAGPTEKKPADHIIFDRVWAHGTPQEETAHGIRLNGVTYAAIVDSTLTDFHCIAGTGGCTDAQAISGGNGDLPAGPFLIQNNFLEASGQDIMFGGGPGTVTPTDITVLRNHMFRPLAWHRGEQGFVGGADGHPFIVKNIFELKVGIRVLLEGNILEYSWGGFSQAGFGILLTPRNQAPASMTQISDVTIRYCIVRHTGSGMQISNPHGTPGALAGERYSIHDVVFEDIDHERFEGHGNLAQISMDGKGDAPVLRHVKIDHVTGFPRHVLLNVGGPDPSPMTDFVFTNNLVSSGERPMTSTGGPCGARRTEPKDLLEGCFKQFEFRNNLIVGSASADWPKGNFFAKNPEQAGLAKSPGSDEFNRLLPSSRYKGKGTDGKDIGADWEAVTAATEGVE